MVSLSGESRQGHAEAQFNLGFIYARQEKIIDHYEKSYMWFMLSKHNGNVKTEEHLNVLGNRMKLSQQEQAESMMKTCLDSHYTNCGN